MAFEISTYDERPTTNKYPEETLARIMAYPLPFIAISPDFHFFGFFDQVFPEIRMGDADEAFSPFPGRGTHEVDDAIFRSDPVDLGARVRNRRARCQRRMMRDSSRPVFLLWNVDRKAMMLLPPRDR